MAYDRGALDKTLAVAAGEDPSLMVERRSAFFPECATAGF